MNRTILIQSRKHAESLYQKQESHPAVGYFYWSPRRSDSCGYCILKTFKGLGQWSVQVSLSDETLCKTPGCVEGPKWWREADFWWKQCKFMAFSLQNAGPAPVNKAREQMCTDGNSYSLDIGELSNSLMGLIGRKHYFHIGIKPS